MSLSSGVRVGFAGTPYIAEVIYKRGSGGTARAALRRLVIDMLIAGSLVRCVAGVAGYATKLSVRTHITHTQSGVYTVDYKRAEKQIYSEAPSERVFHFKRKGTLKTTQEAPTTLVLCICF